MVQALLICFGKNLNITQVFHLLLALDFSLHLDAFDSNKLLPNPLFPIEYEVICGEIRIAEVG